MKNIKDFLNEFLNSAEEPIIENEVNEAKIESEKDFREAAKKKFEEAFGDELDENKMNDTIDGLLNDNKELVDEGKWDELIGMLNKSFNESADNKPAEEIDESKCCKDLSKCSEDELWDELGNLHKIKDEKERGEMFNKIKSQILKIQNEK